jgi:hypothetical protein
MKAFFKKKKCFVIPSETPPLLYIRAEFIESNKEKDTLRSKKKSYTAHTLCTLNVNFIEKGKKSLNCQWIVTAAAYFSYPLEYERRLSNNRESCVIYESHTARQRYTQTYIGWAIALFWLQQQQQQRKIYQKSAICSTRFYSSGCCQIGKEPKRISLKQIKLVINAKSHRWI